MGIRTLHRWHRFVGVIAAVFVLGLTLTGILLNHTEDWALDERYVEHPWLLAWYGIDAPPLTASYRAGEHAVAQVGHTVFVDAEPLHDHASQLLGAVSITPGLAVAVDESLWLLTPKGEVIERLGRGQGLPTIPHALGTTGDGRLALRGPDGVYTADQAFLHWQARPGTQVQWSQTQPPPPALADTLRQRYRGRGLTVERMLLDIHSGRILGTWGVYLMDAAALLLLSLAVTGIILWTRRRRMAT